VKHLATVIYSTDYDAVDPVFFAVVPDSFMRRSGPVSDKRYYIPEGELTDATESPFVAPHDRWSF
jgi:hypothetical protein